jgi:glycosyltransferase involved in cell wall biosynthesis
MSHLLTVLSRLVVAFIGVKLITLLANLVWFPVLRSPSAPGRRGNDSPAPGPTVLLPMRNEAARLPGTLPGLLAGGAAHLVFLDDESTDDSAEIVRRAAADRPSGATPGVTVMAGAPRPDGWTGKTWACHQLAEHTDAELLIFCDVDVELAPGAITAVVEEMERQRADVFSVFPRERTVSWAERLLVPLIDDVVLCFLPFGLLRAPAPSAATACGALLAFRRTAYDTVGGFAAVRTELVEDVAMARLSRRHGLRLGLALGGDHLAVRMCVGYRGVVDNLGRGLTATAGGSRGLVIAGFAWHVLAYTLPTALIGRSWWWRVATLLAVAERMLVESKTGGRDWPAAVAVAASPVAALPVVARAMRRRQTWRGRVYG